LTFPGKNSGKRLSDMRLNMVKHVDGEEMSAEMMFPFGKFRAVKGFDFRDRLSKFSGQADYELTAWPFEFFRTAA
jgi:hypothetical protein